MRDDRLRRVLWFFGGAAIVLAGALAIVRVDIAQRRDAFQTDARIAHRLLSQRAVQHDAILATLTLLGPALDKANRPEQHLSAAQPQVLAVWRRDPGQAWADPAMQRAQVNSQATGRPELAGVEVRSGQFTVVRAGEPFSFALLIDVGRMVPWEEWPIERAGPVSVVLAHAGQQMVIQPGLAVDAQPAGWTEGFVFNKGLATSSQPFELQLRRATGPAEWPWWWLSAWALLAPVAVSGAYAWRQGRRARRRAEALLRVGQVARLNAMGELAAGIAHELNQPLTAVMANTQAARRLLGDDPPELDAARGAMQQAVAQARRAADVVARLRGLVQAPESTPSMRAVQLEGVARQVLELFEPEASRRGVVALMQGQAPPVQADPVALEQIVHNLVGNAMQALEDMPSQQRRLELHVTVEAGQGVLTVRDNGPGIAPDALPRLFEPLYTTRRGGLGLGLSLCETLAQTMQGSLSARNAQPRGAEFRLALPLAGAPA